MKRSIAKSVSMSRSYHVQEYGVLLSTEEQHEHHEETWWRHQMETFSALLALCAGNSPVPVNSPHKGQWRGALMFTFIYAWINDWVNNREAGDLRRQRGHYDVIVMTLGSTTWFCVLHEVSQDTFHEEGMAL